jgi:hypothetical protein
MALEALRVAMRAVEAVEVVGDMVGAKVVGVVKEVEVVFTPPIIPLKNGII